ncbi:MAG: hypothetical protein CMK96_06245 [Pseudomonas sp.]|nr:hypothetical protein [Pseudomonas sp.]QDP67218.1 MAG: hypothetical protein GOVbin7368_9 [Prokaryotic dsDNA virus sp.]|tara:strand:- start:34344 stop:34604 length:261 start_codon:yes stop_codon:yes gene_type:complete
MTLDHHSTSADIARHTAEAQRQDAAEAGKARRLPPLSPAELDEEYRTYKGPWANPPRRKRPPSGWWIVTFALISLLASAGVALIAG